MQNATAEYLKPIKSNGHLTTPSSTKICVIRHKNKKENFRQLALFVFV